MIRAYFYIALAYIAAAVYSVVRAAYDFLWKIECKAFNLRIGAKDAANRAVDQHFGLVWWLAESPGEEIEATADERALRDRFPAVLDAFEEVEED